MMRIAQRERNGAATRVCGLIAGLICLAGTASQALGQETSGDEPVIRLHLWTNQHPPSTQMWYSNGDRLEGREKLLGEDLIEWSYWRVSRDGSATCLHVDRITPAHLVGYQSLCLSPSGMVMVAEVSRDGVRIVRASDTGQLCELRNPPVLRLVVWNPETGEERIVPANVKLREFAWLDDNFIVATRPVDQFGMKCPDRLTILDAKTFARVKEVPAGGGARYLEQVAPGLVAYQLGPDPDNPKPYDETALAMSRLDGALVAYPSLGSRVVVPMMRELMRQSEARYVESRQSAGPDHAGGELPKDGDAVRVMWPDTAPAVPTFDGWNSFGELRLLDMRNPAHPRTTTVMAPFRNDMQYTVSPDGRFVAYNRVPSPVGDGSDWRFVVCDTLTGCWAVVGKPVRDPCWSSDQSEIYALGKLDTPSPAMVFKVGRILKELDAAKDAVFSTTSQRP